MTGPGETQAFFANAFGVLGSALVVIPELGIYIPTLGIQGLTNFCSCGLSPGSNHGQPEAVQVTEGTVVVLGASRLVFHCAFRDHDHHALAGARQQYAIRIL